MVTHQRNAVVLIIAMSFLGYAAVLTSANDLCPMGLSACNCSVEFSNESVSCDLTQDSNSSNSCCSERMVAVNETTCCNDAMDCPLCTKLANCTLESCWLCNTTLPSCNTSTTSSQPISTMATPTSTMLCPDKTAPYLTPDNGRCVARCGFIGIMKPENKMCQNMVLAYFIDSLICAGIPLTVIVIIVVSIVCCRKKHGICHRGRRSSDDEGPMDLKPLPSKNELSGNSSLKHITSRALSVKNDYKINRVQDEWRHDHIQSEPDYGPLPGSQDSGEQPHDNQRGDSDDPQEDYTPMDNFQSQQCSHPASQQRSHPASQQLLLPASQHQRKPRGAETVGRNPGGHKTVMGNANTASTVMEDEVYENFSADKFAGRQKSSPVTSRDSEDEQEVYENGPAMKSSQSLVEALRNLSTSIKYKASATTSPAVPERTESTLEEEYSEVATAQDTPNQRPVEYYAGRQSYASMGSEDDDDLYQNVPRKS